MCGIIGVLTKKKNLKDLIFRSLHRLSYRGYDSSGFASFGRNNEKNFNIIKCIGCIENLENKINSRDCHFSENLIGIAHTRWATHGEVKEENTHPLHTDLVCVVHNGVIENYHDIKNKLISQNYKFYSKTDTELIPILITKFLKEDGSSKLNAISSAFNILHGTFAVLMIFKDEPNRIYAYKSGSPLVFSYSDDKQIFCISSDVYSIALTSDYFIKIEDSEILVLDSEEKFFDERNYEFYNSKTLEKIKKTNIQKIKKTDVDSSSKEGFESHMLKEIYEQPKAVLSTIASLYDASNNDFLVKTFFTKEYINTQIIKLIGCGSSFISANIGSYYLRKISLINSFVENASELRYTHDPIGIYDLMIFISQSGETADVLASMSEIRASSQKKLIALTNNEYSTISSISDYNLFTKAEQEISVASTKTFTTQISVFIYLSIFFAKIKGLIDENESLKMMQKLLSTPRKINELLNNQNFLIRLKEIANIISKQSNVFFLGREIYFYVASEGSLKLKEISYINSQSLVAGELKHGPLALIDSSSYIVFMLPENELYEKNIITIEEILTRKANIIIITDTKKTSEYFADYGSFVQILLIEEEYDFFTSPFLFTISIQLIAYETSKILGRNIDQPRNLAKSVTVE
jgi:glucosamine--fructose-6-phosphate aminotransferase (isomerizing)